MRVSGPWLDAAQPVFAMLDGHRVLAVGGSVRNALLGQPVADVDLATDALPDQVMRAAEAAGLKAVPTGIDHGTVTIIVEGSPYEVTTFRHDAETDGRHARVEFSTDLAQDARRRDFTMNALYATADGEVVDPLGGLDDLLARHVRFVGDAHERIREDYLRILRFFRFHAWYGDPDAGIDPDGLAACAELADGIATLSRERVGAEMLKLLSAPDPAPAVAAMAASGVLAQVIPGADARALAPLVHLEGCMPSDPLRRLAVLGGEVDLRLSRADARRLQLLGRVARDSAGPAELGYRHGVALALDAGLLRAALLGQDVPPGWEEAARTGASARFPIRAADLGAEITGAEIGKALRSMETRWIASGFSLSRDELLREIGQKD